MLRLTRCLRFRGADVDLPTFKKLILQSAFSQASAASSSPAAPAADSFVLVDVRQDEELAAHGTAPNSLHIPLGELQETLLAASDWAKERLARGGQSASSSAHAAADDWEAIAKENELLTRLGGPGEKNVVFFCRSGNRTLYAMQLASALGYQTCHVAGGWSLYETDPLTDDDIAAYVAEKKARETK